MTCGFPFCRRRATDRIVAGIRETLLCAPHKEHVETMAAERGGYSQVYAVGPWGGHRRLKWRRIPITEWPSL